MFIYILYLLCLLLLLTNWFLLNFCKLMQFFTVSFLPFADWKYICGWLDRNSQNYNLVWKFLLAVNKSFQMLFTSWRPTIIPYFRHQSEEKTSQKPWRKRSKPSKVKYFFFFWDFRIYIWNVRKYQTVGSESVFLSDNNTSVVAHRGSTTTLHCQVAKDSQYGVVRRKKTTKYFYHCKMLGSTTTFNKYLFLKICPMRC